MVSLTIKCLFFLTACSRRTFSEIIISIHFWGEGGSAEIVWLGQILFLCFGCYHVQNKRANLQKSGGRAYIWSTTKRIWKGHGSFANANIMYQIHVVKANLQKLLWPYLSRPVQYYRRGQKRFRRDLSLTTLCTGNERSILDCTHTQVSKGLNIGFFYPPYTP